MAPSSGSATIFPGPPPTPRGSATGRSSPGARCSPPARSSARIVFGGNDRPGVMLAGAVRTYLNRFAAAPGRRAVVFANNDEAAATTARSRRGRHHRRRRHRHPAGRTGRDPHRGTRTRAPRSLPGAASSRPGAARGGMRSVLIRNAGGRDLHLACDLVAVSGGWTPTIQPHLAPRRQAAFGMTLWRRCCRRRCRRE